MESKQSGQQPAGKPGLPSLTVWGRWAADMVVVNASNLQSWEDEARGLVDYKAKPSIKTNHSSRD